MNDAQALSEGRALVEGGDLDLADYKTKFETAHKRPTLLNDDEAIIAIMQATEEDWEPDDVVIQAMFDYETRLLGFSVKAE